MIRRMIYQIRVMKSTLVNQFDLYTIFGSLEREDGRDLRVKRDVEDSK